MSETHWKLISPKGLRPETLAVAFGYDPADALGAVKPPVYLTSTFIDPSPQHAQGRPRGILRGHGSARWRPAAGISIRALVIPGSIFLKAGSPRSTGLRRLPRSPSGMAAHSSIALTFVQPGDSVLHGRPIYGGVDMLYGSVMPRFGTQVETYQDGTDPDGVRAAARAAMAKGPLALIVAETPANPTAAIVDLDLMVAVADEIGRETGRRRLVAVDNTLLGPFSQRPIEHGVDLCMTSLTKYCAGHSDLLAGGVSGKLELIHQLANLARRPGQPS